MPEQIHGCKGGEYELVEDSFGRGDIQKAKSKPTIQVRAQDVLFICGQAHIENFSRLLEAKGVEVTVVAERIASRVRDVVPLREFVNEVRYGAWRREGEVHQFGHLGSCFSVDCPRII